MTFESLTVNERSGDPHWISVLDPSDTRQLVAGSESAGRLVLHGHISCPDGLETRVREVVLEALASVEDVLVQTGDFFGLNVRVSGETIWDQATVTPRESNGALSESEREARVRVLSVLGEALSKIIREREITRSTIMMDFEAGLALAAGRDTQDSF